jgi:hypothetical protein
MPRKGNWKDFGFGTVDGYQPDERHDRFKQACKRIGSLPQANVIKEYLEDLIAADIDPNAPDGALRQHLAERKVAKTLALFFAGDDDRSDRADDR